MQVAKLQQAIAEYKTFLRRDREGTGLYKWESLRQFQEQWDLAAADFGHMYERSLYNSQRQQLWKGPGWFPKEMMLEIIKVAPDQARDLFTGLCEEEWEPGMRISHFKDVCDELLKNHNHLPGLWRENDHYHGDNRMVFLYLSFCFPEKYTLFDYAPFRKTLSLLGTQDIPGAYDTGRFIKLSKAMYLFLQKDTELLDLHRKRRDPRVHYMGDSMLLVHDFYERIGK